MNFLELVKKLAQRTGTELQAKIETTDLTPAPLYGSSTEHVGRLVDWIQQAWSDIQDDQPEWNFMMREGVMPLRRGQLEYAIKAIVDESLPAGWEDYRYEKLIPFTAPRDARYIWLVDGSVSPPNRNFCYYVPPERFFGSVDRYSDRNVGLPSRYTFDRMGCIVFNAMPPSDDLYIKFEYRAEQHQLLLNTDVPRGLPEKFHILVVYQALLEYAMFDETEPQFRRARKLRRDMMNKLRLQQLREYSMVGTKT